MTNYDKHENNTFKAVVYISPLPNILKFRARFFDGFLLETTIYKAGYSTV